MTQPAMGNFTTDAGVFTVAPFQDENRPFDLAMLGIKASGMSTACYEGWLPSYAMWSGRLYLAELNVYAYREELPDICGIFPEEPSRGGCYYRGLRLPFGFCGDLDVTTDTGLTAWRGDCDGMKVRFTLSFHGGLLRAVDNTSYNIDTAMSHIYCPPYDRPVDDLPLPDRSTPFDEYVIPLTEYEKERLLKEEGYEVHRAERRQRYREESLRKLAIPPSQSIPPAV